MAMGTRKHRQRQERLWVTHADLATGPGHPFYARLNELLDEEKFDEFAESECDASTPGNTAALRFRPESISAC